MLSGTIDSAIGNLPTTLFSFHINNNELTGELPNVFNNFPILNSFLIQNNKFQGPIPNTLWDTNVKEFYLLNNDLTGTVSDTFCDRNERRISVDDSIWFEDKPKVNCSCCNKGKYYIWNIVDDTAIPCPHKNLFPLTFDLSYQINDTITEESISRKSVSPTTDANLCLSPTGCYEFQYTTIRDDADINSVSNPESMSQLNH